VIILPPANGRPPVPDYDYGNDQDYLDAQDAVELTDNQQKLIELSLLQVKVKEHWRRTAHGLVRVHAFVERRKGAQQVFTPTAPTARIAPPVASLQKAPVAPPTKPQGAVGAVEQLKAKVAARTPQVGAPKAPTGPVHKVQRGIALEPSPELAKKIADLTANPETESQIDQHLRLGSLILDEIQGHGPNKQGANAWTGSAGGVADIASGARRGGSHVPVKIEATYQGQRVGSAGFKTEDEHTIPTGTPMTVTGIKIKVHGEWLDVLDKPVEIRNMQPDAPKGKPTTNLEGKVPHYAQPPHMSAKGADLPAPMTDDEYVAHTQMVETRLHAAREAGQETDKKFATEVKIDGKTHLKWDAKRKKQQDEILDQFWAEAASVPNDGKAMISGGLGGSGKGTVLAGPEKVDTSQYLTVDADEIKSRMAAAGMVPTVEGLSPMECAALVHEESSDMSKRLAERAYKEKKNIVWDITMSSTKSVNGRIDDLHNNGYHTKGVFVDIPIETAVKRALGRHRSGLEQYRQGKGYGGRYVPPGVIRLYASAGSSSTNHVVFDTLSSQMDDWIAYDNSENGAAPVVIGRKSGLSAAEKKTAAERQAQPQWMTIQTGK